MPATILSLPTEIRLMIFSYVFKTYTIYGLLPYSTVTHAGVSSLPKGHLRASIPLTCRLFHAESVFLVRFHAVLQCDHNTLLSKGRGLARVALPVHVLAGLRYLSVRMAYDDILVNGSTSFTSSLSRAIPEQCRPTIRTTSLCLSKDATPSQLSRMERHFQCERRAKNVLQVLMCLIDMLPSLQNVLAVYGSNVAEGGRGAEACERYLQSWLFRYIDGTWALDRHTKTYFARDWIEPRLVERTVGSLPPAFFDLELYEKDKKGLRTGDIKKKVRVWFGTPEEAKAYIAHTIEEGR